MSGKLHRTSRGVKSSGFTDNQKGQHTPFSALVSSTRVHSVIRSLFLPCSRLFCSYLSFMSCRVLSCYYLSVTLIGKMKWDEIIFLSLLPLDRHLAVYTVS